MALSLKQAAQGGAKPNPKRINVLVGEGPGK
jgi:hypothetical protein